MNCCYIICTTARSGSNLLCDYLSQTDLAGRPGELFNPRVIRDGHRGKKFRHSGKIKLEEYVAWAQSEFSTKNGAFGIKILFEQLEFFQRSRVLSDLFQTSKLIYLSRRNKVKQAVSYYLAEQTGQWAHFEPPKKKLEQVEYNSSRLRGHFERLHAQDKYWELLFCSNGYSVMPVIFEDFLGSERIIIGNILKLIDVVDENFAVVAHLHDQQSNKNRFFFEKFSRELQFTLGGADGPVFEFEGITFY